MSASPRGILATILLLAAALRFTGIGWGLRHLPYQYERVFVQSVWNMVAAHDLNQRSFLYPGLFFYLLALPIAAVQTAGLAIPYAYLTARCVVAAFGVANVALTFLLGSRLANASVGLVAALLVAVSPLEVETCHAVRPDVVLETFVLLGFLTFRSLGREGGGDLRSGLVMGAATAVKVTGAFLVPSYIVHRLLAPGRPGARIVLAGLVALLVFFLATPYAVLAPGRFLEGSRAQLAHHYVVHQGSSSHAELLLLYLRAIGEHLGLLGSAFLAVGIAKARRELGTLGPLLLFPLLAVAVFSTAHVGGARFLVPAGGILAIVAARALKSPLEGALGWVLAGSAALLPLVASVHLLRQISEPSSMDKALDWIGGSLPPGSWVFTTEKHLGLDRTRYRVIWPETAYGLGDPPTWRDRLLAQHADLVVADPEDPTVQGLSEVHRVQSRNPFATPLLGIFVPSLARTAGRPIPLEEARLSASENAALLPSLADAKGFWSTTGPESPDSWVQVEFSSRVWLERVEITAKNHVGSPLRVLSTDDGASWRELRLVEVDDSDQFPPKQILLLEPSAVSCIRIIPAKRFLTRWTIVKLLLVEAREPPRANAE